MREIDTMWQIGVSTGKPLTAHCLGPKTKNWSFSAFWHSKNSERFSKAPEVKSHVPSPCLDASKNGLLLEFTHEMGFFLLYIGQKQGCTGASLGLL